MTTDNPTTTRKPLTAAVISGVAILVLVLVVLAYASPYLVLSRLRDAVQQRNAQMIDRYVDYPSLRTSLKQQVTQMLSRRVETQKLQHPFEALGALVGMALVDPLVDAYATPDGVAALLAGMPPHGTPGETPAPVGEQPADQAPQQHDAQSSPAADASPASEVGARRAASSAGYRDISTFAVSYSRNAGNPPYSVIFHRRGWFSWQIDAVELPS